MSKTKYSKEFKIRAVHLSDEEDVTCKEVAEDLGMSVYTLYEWRSQYKEHGADAFPGSGNQTPENERIAELEKEVEKLKNERYVLKKQLCR